MMKKKPTKLTGLIAVLGIELLVLAGLGLFFISQTSDVVPSTEVKAPANEYLGAIHLGAEWFLNNQDDEFLKYEFDLDKNLYVAAEHPLREMAALWSIAKAANFTGDQRYEQLAIKGWEYFKEELEYDEQLDFSYSLATPEKIKLGYPAFLILALLEMDVDDKDLYLERLAKSIVWAQKDDGSFKTVFFSDTQSSQDYYPGEALVAIMSLYEATGNEDYLKVAADAFPFYREYFKARPNTAFVPWQTRAYYKYYQANPNPEVADYVFTMNDFILDAYSPSEDCKSFKFKKGITTAVYLEGVNQAYLLAKDLNDEKRMTCYGNFIPQAADHLISLQVQESDSVQAIGGFKGSKTSHSIRVDNNQHAIMALMDAYEHGLLK